MELSILYYSKTGRTRDIALAIQRGAEKIEGMEAKAFPLDEIDEDFLKESWEPPMLQPTISRAAPIQQL